MRDELLVGNCFSKFSLYPLDQIRTQFTCLRTQIVWYLKNVNNKSKYVSYDHLRRPNIMMATWDTHG